MIKVSIIGSGNIAQHLIAAFAENPSIKLVQAMARHPEKLQRFAGLTEIVGDVQLLKPADVCLLAVSDSAISDVAAQIDDSQFVVHTAGSVPIDALGNRPRRGSFYPLQTFSANRPVDWTEIPIFAEASAPEEVALLLQLGKALSPRVTKVTYQQRLALHLAAVFVCNFVNHMYDIGDEICQENQLDFSVLHPLIRETASKIENMSPREAQTGPARRQDCITLTRHSDALTKENLKELYQLLSTSISKRYEL